MKDKIAIILFNLGGPDSPRAVKPFLFNLFYDPAIIDLPNPFRWFLAKLISSKREKEAQEIYGYLGGKSPILGLTKEQSEELQKRFGDKNVKTFVSMRYWHPFSHDVVKKVKEYNPDRIILLPLYPQYSTTTTKSSFDDWRKVCKKEKYSVPTTEIYNYHLRKSFVDSHVLMIGKEYNKAKKKGTPRILFSAHGLPEKVITKRGDPYQKQIEETAEAIIKELGIKELDWSICYQSRVGPMKWIGPSTDDEIVRSAKDGVPVVIVPIAFVSEHSETLVELDIEYKELAKENGLTDYFRVPALGTNELFIDSLVDICEYVLSGDKDPGSGVLYRE